MTQLNDLRKVVLIEQEVTYSTDVAPAAATDAMLCRSITVEPLVLEYVDRTLVRPFFGAFTKLPTTKMVKITIEQELAGFGTAGPATPTLAYHAALEACGLSGADSGAFWTYTPVGTAFDSCTIWFYQDGTVHKAAGCRGNFKLKFKRNEIPTITYEFTGLIKDSPADLAIVTPTISAFQVPKIVNQVNTGVFSLHGYATACLDELTFDLGNVLAYRNLVNCTEQVLITDRKPKGTVNMEAVKPTEKDWWSAIIGDMFVAGAGTGGTAAVPTQGRDFATISASLTGSPTLGSLTLTHGPLTNQVSLKAASTVQLTNPRFDKMDNIVHMLADLEFIPTSAGNNEFALEIA